MIEYNDKNLSLWNIYFVMNIMGLNQSKDQLI